METISPATVWAWVLAAASALVLLFNAAEKIAKAVKSYKAPNEAQNARLDALEAWKQDVDRKLESDYIHLKSLDEGNRVSQRALLALLGHGIDGNNLSEMEAAKTELQNHLINR